MQNSFLDSFCLPADQAGIPGRATLARDDNNKTKNTENKTVFHVLSFMFHDTNQRLLARFLVRTGCIGSPIE
ncbi:MAG: hypothetical protein V1690_00820 [Candidatus Moraniibacteriota bacterium]